MKIALCFSGQPRFITKCFPNIEKNILKPNGYPDIYVHTWYPEPWPKEYQICDNSYGDLNGLEQIIKLYQPKSFIVNRPVIFDKILDTKHMYAQYQYITQSMFYSIEESLKLVTHPENYDYLVRIRFDIQFNEQIKFSDYDSTKLNTKREFTGRMNDHFGFGNSGSLNGYRQAFTNIKEYVNKYDKLTPEEILEYTYQKLKIPIQCHNWESYIERKE
ncbi:MAG TPA: hypothetical protein PLD02_03975 [Saprospiraceae bacterium]|nr:hypothetical protein [Saprospiraceae bacterium]